MTFSELQIKMQKERPAKEVKYLTIQINALKDNLNEMSYFADGSEFTPKRKQEIYSQSMTELTKYKSMLNN